jgi:hypothetical protein
MTMRLADIKPTDLSPQLQVRLLEMLRDVGPYGYGITSRKDFMECATVDKHMNLFAPGCKGDVVTSLELFRHIEQNYPGWAQFIPILIKGLIAARRLDLQDMIDNYQPGPHQILFIGEVIRKTKHGVGYHTRDEWLKMIISIMATYDLGKMLPFREEVRMITDMVDCMESEWETYALLAVLVLNYGKVLEAAKVDLDPNFKFHLTPESFLRAHPSAKVFADDAVFTNFPIGPV